MDAREKDKAQLQDRSDAHGLWGQRALEAVGDDERMGQNGGCSCPWQLFNARDTLCTPHSLGVSDANE